MPHADAEARRKYHREYRRRRSLDPKWREHTNALNRARYAASPEKRKETERRYVAAHPDRVLQRRRRWRSKNALRTAVYRYRALGWQGDERLLVDLLTDNCFYCGASPNPVNGVDRVNSEKEHTADNVVTACSRCNVAKLDQPVSSFSAWIDAVSKHHIHWRGFA